MQDTLAFIDTLTVPTDAGPNDDRVVIGPGDEIRIFNNSDLVLVADPNGLIVGPDLDLTNPFTASTQFALLSATTSEIELRFPTNIEEASIRATRLAAIDRLILEMQNTLVEIRNDGVVNVEADDLRINEISVPRGIIAQFSSEVNDPGGPYSADSVTDMVLTNVSVIAGRTYAIHLHTLMEGSAVGLQWNVFCRINGTNLGRFFRIDTSDELRPSIDQTLYWTPSVTASTDDIDVFLDEVVGAGTMALLGSADNLIRTLTLIDLGTL